jgi:hypothetical protein
MDMRVHPMPSAGASTVSPMLVRDLQDGQDLDQVLLVVTERAVEKHVTSIFNKLSLPPAQEDHRRVLAVLTYLKA